MAVRRFILLGASTGLLLWCLFVAVFLTIRSSPSPALEPLHELIDVTHAICAILAFPVYWGGWFFLWGDDGPPHDFLNNIVLNCAAGILLNATLVVAFLWILDHRRRSASSRDMTRT